MTLRDARKRHRAHQRLFVWAGISILFIMFLMYATTVSIREQRRTLQLQPIVRGDRACVEPIPEYLLRYCTVRPPEIP